MFNVGDKPIKKVRQFKYLGHIVDDSDKDDSAIDWLEAFGHDLGNYCRERVQIQLQWEFSIRSLFNLSYCMDPSLG